MTEVAFPGGIGELEFVRHYHASVLRKPQVVADAALRTLVYASAIDRAVLAGVVAEQATEAARRLAAVHGALADRRYSVARSLLGPLPGADEWSSFAQRAAVLTPEQMLRDMSLGDDAIESAQQLRSQPDLANLTRLIEAATSGNLMLILPGGESGRMLTEAWLAGTQGDGPPVVASIGVSETDAAGLADLAAEFSSIARGFLGAYLGARHSAGKRD